MFNPYLTSPAPLDSLWRVHTDGITWVPVIAASIIHRGYESRVVDAIVDSGSQFTLFEGTIGTRVGIDVRNGRSEQISLAAAASNARVYFHEVTLRVQRQSIRTVVGFCFELSVPALLGRHGFFDHFKITFDPLRRGMQIDRAIS
ncbi:MAG: hypothetical protein FJW38_00350 [Acidobacteria bacterium]|nr:hypothetical protein [Acidobacteriota bacterium]